MLRKMIEYKLAGILLWYVGMLLFVAGLLVMITNPQLAGILEILLTIFMFALLIYYFKYIYYPK